MKRLILSIGVAFGAVSFSANADGVDKFADTGRAHLNAKSSKAVQKAKIAKIRPGAKYSARRAKLISVVKSTKPSSLPLGLVDAVIAKESRYNVNARGSSGEIGLMQIMPSTARRIAKSLGQHKVAKMSGTDLRKYLTDARTNVRYGTKYLAKCHKMAKGNIGATIGCYNAGPANMWRWSKIDITKKYVHYVRRHMADNG